MNRSLLLLKVGYISNGTNKNDITPTTPKVRPLVRNTSLFGSIILHMRNAGTNNLKIIIIHPLSQNAKMMSMRFPYQSMTALQILL